MSVAEQKPAAESKTPKKPENDPVIDRLIEKIAAAQQEEYADKKQIIISKLKQGALLKKLKEQAAHGRWESYLETLAYNKSNAERLMLLAGSWWEDEILTMGQDLLKHLPTELQKLVKLTELSAAQACELLALTDLDDMSREELRAAVDAKLLAAGKKLNPRAATRVAQCRQPMPTQERSAVPEEVPAVTRVLPRTSDGGIWEARRAALYASNPPAMPLNHREPVPIHGASTEHEAVHGNVPTADGTPDRFAAACQTIAELTDAERKALVTLSQKGDGGLLRRQIDGAMMTLTDLRACIEVRGPVGTAT